MAKTLSFQEQRAIRDLASGNFVPSLHADQRMAERGVRFQDIVSVGESWVEVRAQVDGTIRVVGDDLDGQELNVICAFDGGTLVVTVF